MAMTPEQQARVRLQNEFLELKKIRRNDIMEFVPAPGEVEPYVRNYIVTYHIPTFVDNGNSIQQTTVVKVSIPDNFPQTQPIADVVQGRVPFHVNWWADGHLCNGNFWNSGRWLYEYFGFIGEVLQFRPDRINVGSPANRNAIPFFQANRHRMPTDSRPMPVPNRHKMTIL